MPILTNVSKLYTCAAGQGIEQGAGYEAGQGAEAEHGVRQGAGYEAGQREAGLIEGAALVWEGDRILWVGKESECPEEYGALDRVDADSSIVIPGLVDCHTHLCFGGWRADEFEQRILGKSYLEIAKAGGGIRSTMRATREAGEEELFEKAAGLLREMHGLGVTAVECKSGYGLSLEAELKQLRVYRRLRDQTGMHVVSTFLGAHMVPPEYRENREGYLNLLVEEMIPRVAEEGLAQYCDVFVEDSAFTPDEARRIFRAARDAGLIPKLHADQLTPGGGAELAAEVGAVSADHLEQISGEGILAMAKAGVVAVTLPLASLYTQQPFLDGRKLVDAGVPVAVATDFNPGSAPSFDLPLAMMLACNQSRLTPAEVLNGATRVAARAIGLEAVTGSLEPGKSADFLLVDAESVNEWLYHFKGSRMKEVYLRGSRSSSEKLFPSGF